MFVNSNAAQFCCLPMCLWVLLYFVLTFLFIMCLPVVICIVPTYGSVPLGMAITMLTVHLTTWEPSLLFVLVRSLGMSLLSVVTMTSTGELDSEYDLSWSLCSCPPGNLSSLSLSLPHPSVSVSSPKSESGGEGQGRELLESGSSHSDLDSMVQSQLYLVNRQCNVTD